MTHKEFQVKHEFTDEFMDRLTFICRLFKGKITKFELRSQNVN